ncbi:MAG: hypothetical protein IMZ50_06775 [Candidatus Atribacteria bacterium]|nr:hypothetical protein [Candidatus Atribacteria bacterium]
MKKGKREHHPQAYRPRPPFKIIEGVGTELFRRLSPWAVWTLARFYDKFTGKNRANLSLTYKEVKDTMSSVVFIRSIWELVGFGFLDILRFGRLERNASLYALSDRWRSLDDPEKCEKIKSILEEIRELQRKRAVSYKRAQLNALRDRLLGRQHA